MPLAHQALHVVQSPARARLRQSGLGLNGYRRSVGSVRQPSAALALRRSWVRVPFGPPRSGSVPPPERVSDLNTPGRRPLVDITERFRSRGIARFTILSHLTVCTSTVQCKAARLVESASIAILDSRLVRPSGKGRAASGRFSDAIEFRAITMTSCHSSFRAYSRGHRQGRKRRIHAVSLRDCRNRNAVHRPS